jgi:hypothetical protein
MKNSDQLGYTCPKEFYKKKITPPKSKENEMIFVKAEIND